jgi:hypothetical protein
MIELCFNPECNEELLYLRQGCIYALESGWPTLCSEFFWLCPTCCRAFELVPAPDGRPVLSPIAKRVRTDRECGRVRRVFGGVISQHLKTGEVHDIEDL